MSDTISDWWVAERRAVLLQLSALQYQSLGNRRFRTSVFVVAVKS